MWSHFESVSYDVQRIVLNMDSQQWLVVSAIAIAAGGYFLRGFGSRTGY